MANISNLRGDAQSDLLEQEKNTRDFSHEMNFLADSKCIEKSVHSGEKSSNKET